MKKQRPKNLNLLTIRFPVPAIASILHRISGVILFLFIPFMLWVLNCSLASYQSFNELKSFLTTPWVKLIFLSMAAAFFYHLAAGIRHLFMDLHIGIKLRGARLSAWLTIITAVFLTLLTGVWLW